MRTLVWMLALGLLGGGVAIVLTGRDEDSHAETELVAGDGATPADEGHLLSAKAAPVVTIAKKGTWIEDLAYEGHPITDSRIIDVQVYSPDGEMWTITGKKLVDIMESELKGMGIQVRFESEEALRDFESRSFKNPIPGVTHLGMLLELCTELGYRVVTYGGMIHVAKIGPPPHGGVDQHYIPPDSPTNGEPK